MNNTGNEQTLFGNIYFTLSSSHVTKVLMILFIRLETYCQKSFLSLIFSNKPMSLSIMLTGYTA